jgi:1,2-beta-oligoglucan phosphorylase
VPGRHSGLRGRLGVYSSGPGIYTNLLIRNVLGYDRRWGERFTQPLLPVALLGMVAKWDYI